MRMLFKSRHDIDRFETMVCNQIEPWSKRFICETLLWLPTHHIMRRRLNIRCVRKYGSLRIMAYHAHYFIGKMLYACVLYISVHRHASHHTCISYAKHDDDRLMILPFVSNIIRTKTIEQRTIPVVPHKAVAEVSKSRKPIGEVGCCDARMAEQSGGGSGGLSICLSICLAIWVSVDARVYFSVYLSIYLSIYLSACLSICQSICLSICVSIDPCTCFSVYLSVNQSIYLSVYPSIYLSIFLPIYLSIHLSIYRSTYLSIHPSINLSIYLFVYLFIYFFPIYLSISSSI